jgi:hypothetical protein
MRAPPESLRPITGAHLHRVIHHLAIFSARASDSALPNE